LFYNTVIENKIAMAKIDYAITEQVGLNSRIHLVLEGLDYSSQNLFLGNGFQSVIINRQSLSKDYNYLGWDGSHNSFIELLIDVGILGPIVLLLFLKRIINNSSSHRKKRSNQLRNNVGIMGYMITSLFLLTAFVTQGLFKDPAPFTPLFMIFVACINKLKILPEITNNKAHNYFFNEE